MCEKVVKVCYYDIEVMEIFGVGEARDETGGQEYSSVPVCCTSQGDH